MKQAPSSLHADSAGASRVMHRSTLAEKLSGWQAGLALDFCRSGKKTVLRQTEHYGPLQTQRPFYPEGEEICHVYILHPPGGVVGGDQLEMKMTVHPFANALVTTPAAGKFYRSSGPRSALNQKMTVADNAVLEWLPQENIIYNQARAGQTTTVELGENACFLGWEISCLGLQASNEPFKEGSFVQTFDIRQHGVPLLIERASFETNSAIFQAAWGLRNHSVTATLICNRIQKEDREQLLKAIRLAAASLEEDGLFSVTTVSDMIVCRYLGHHAYKARKYFVAAWKILRKTVLGRSVCLPRIWNT